MANRPWFLFRKRREKTDEKMGKCAKYNFHILIGNNIKIVHALTPTEISLSSLSTQPNFSAPLLLPAKQQLLKALFCPDYCYVWGGSLDFFREVSLCGQPLITNWENLPSSPALPVAVSSKRTNTPEEEEGTAISGTVLWRKRGSKWDQERIHKAFCSVALIQSSGGAKGLAR